MTAHVNSNFDGKVLIITRVWRGLCLSHARFTEMRSLVFMRLCQYAGTRQLTTDLSPGDNPSEIRQVTLIRELGSKRWFL